MQSSPNQTAQGEAFCNEITKSVLVIAAVIDLKHMQLAALSIVNSHLTYVTIISHQVDMMAGFRFGEKVKNHSCIVFFVAKRKEAEEDEDSKGSV